MFWEVENHTHATVIRFQVNYLDSTNSADVKTEFIGLLGTGAKYLVVNLSKIKRIDSSGLGTLLFGQRQTAANDGWFRLAEVPEAVMKLIKIGMLDRAFDIYNTEAEAVRDV